MTVPADPAADYRVAQLTTECAALRADLQPARTELAVARAERDAAVAALNNLSATVEDARGVCAAAVEQVAEAGKLRTEAQALVADARALRLETTSAIRAGSIVRLVPASPAYVIRWPHKGDPPAPGTPDNRRGDYNAWLQRVSDGACVFEDGRLSDAPEDLTLGRDLSALVDELNALAAGFPDPPLPTSRG